MNFLNFIVNTYDLFQEVDKLGEQGKNSFAKYLLQHKDRITGLLTKENNSKELAIKLLSSELVNKTCPELSDFVRKHYADLKK